MLTFSETCYMRGCCCGCGLYSRGFFPCLGNNGAWAGEGFLPVRATGVGETKEEGKEEGKGEEVRQRPGNTFLMTTGKTRLENFLSLWFGILHACNATVATVANVAWHFKYEYYMCSTHTICTTCKY